jgi:hypothetical protein
MKRWSRRFEATKVYSTLLVLYIPSADRFGKELGRGVQGRLVRRALEMLGRNMSGGTAFPRGLGIWRDDARGGKLVWDHPVIIQCYTSEEILEQSAGSLRKFLVEMGVQTNQGAVGFVIGEDFFEIDLPLKEV